MGNCVLDRIRRHPQALKTIAIPRGRIGLHALPTAAGIELRDTPDYAWDGLQRGDASFVVVQHTLAGRGRLDYEGRQIVLTPGSTMLVRIPHAHRYYVARGESWHFFFLVLAGREIVQLADAILAAAGPVQILDSAQVETLAGICLDMVSGPALSTGTLSALAYRAMTVLFDAASAGTPEEQQDWLADITSHIAQNLARPLPVEDLALRAGMSRAHFVRQFTRAAGSAPSEYVFSQRMQMAAQLLGASGMSVAEIAGACGFGNANYFAKAFRRAFDVSPSAFRASGMYSMPATGDRRRVAEGAKE